MKPKRSVDSVLSTTAEQGRLWVSPIWLSRDVRTRSETWLLGTYGNFEIMPLLCPDGFETCSTTLAARERYRMNDTDGMNILKSTFYSKCEARPTRCLPWLFLTNSRQRDQNRGHFDSSCRLRTIHLPQRRQTVLCIGPCE